MKNIIKLISALSKTPSQTNVSHTHVIQVANISNEIQTIFSQQSKSQQKKKVKWAPNPGF